MSLDWIEHALWYIADVSVKVGLMVIAAAALLWISRTRDAFVQHSVWTTVLVGMLVVVPVGFFVTSLELAVPISTRRSVVPESVAPRVSTPTPSPRPRPSAPVPPGTVAQATSASSQTQSPERVPWGAVILVAYAFGLSIVLTRILVGLAVRRHLVHAARRVRSEPAQRINEALAAAAGVAPARLLESMRTRVPFAVPGTIVLPQSWRSWSSAQLASVVAHETAHLQRRDPWIQLAGWVNRALYWFHPAAVWVSRRLAIHAEEACDRLAIRWTGQTHRQYAAHLVDVAAPLAANSSRVLVGSVPFARRSQVRRRIDVLARNQDVRSITGRSWVYPVVLIGLLAASGFRFAPRAVPIHVDPVIPQRDSVAPQVARQLPDTSRQQDDLIGRLRSPDPFVRARAANHLRRRDPSSAAIAALIPLLGDRTEVSLPEEDETDPGREAARTLGAYRERAVDTLLAVLRSGEVERRGDALFALSLTGSARAYSRLIAALSDPSWRIREQAARGLGLYDTRAAGLTGDRGVSDLIERLYDEDNRVREQVAWALGMMGDSSAVPALIDALTDGDARVREGAARALHMIGDARAVDALRRVEQDRDESSAVRSTAATAVAGLVDANLPVMATRILSSDYGLGDGDAFRVSLTYGEIRIERSATDRVESEVHIECVQGRASCEDLLSHVELARREWRDGTWLDIEYLFGEAAKEQLVVEATIRVPGGATRVEVELRAGGIDIDLPQRVVSRVELTSDLGRPELTGHDIEGQIRHRRRGDDGHQITWIGGRGDTEIVADIGVGTISMRMN